jgi:ketosteroid isomerase-like protein
MIGQGIRHSFGARWSSHPREAGVVVVAIVAALTAPGAGLGAQDRSDVAEEVRLREIAFAQTMADRDHDAFLTFVSPEAVFFDGDTPIRGSSAVGAAWAPLFEGAEAPFSWRPDVVEVLDSGELALSSGPVRGPDGAVVGRFNSIWRRDADGVWRVIFDKGCS